MKTQTSEADLSGFQKPDRSCTPSEGHCITCSDEALSARVLQVDPAMALAQVEMAGMEMTDVITEVDISLLEDVAVGSWLLIHGGVALEHLGEAA